MTSISGSRPWKEGRKKNTVITFLESFRVILLEWSWWFPNPLPVDTWIDLLRFESLESRMQVWKLELHRVSPRCTKGPVGPLYHESRKGNSLMCISQSRHEILESWHEFSLEFTDSKMPPRCTLHLTWGIQRYSSGSENIMFAPSYKPLVEKKSWLSTSWWLNQPIWKICNPQIGNHLPQKNRGETKKWLSCNPVI